MFTNFVGTNSVTGSEFGDMLANSLELAACHQNSSVIIGGKK